MKRFWWIVRGPVWTTLGAAGWLGVAVLCGKRWGFWGVTCCAMGPLLLGFVGLLGLCVLEWYKERGEEYDRFQRWAAQDRAAGRP